MPMGDNYIENIKKIWRLTNPPQAEGLSGDEFCRRLWQQYAQVRSLFDDNIDYLKQEILPYLTQDAVIPEETEAQLLDFCTRLASLQEMKTVDRILCQKIYESLLRCARLRGDRQAVLHCLRQLIVLNYHMTILLNRSYIGEFDPLFFRYNDAALAYAREVNGYLKPEIFTGLSDVEKDHVLMASRYEFLFYPGSQHSRKSLEDKVDAARRSLDISRDSFYRSCYPGFDWDTQEESCLYYASICGEYLEEEGNDPAILDFILQAAQDLTRIVRSQKPDMFIGEREADILLARIRYISREIGEAEYLNLLNSYYDLRDPGDYSSEGIACNLLTAAQINDLIAPGSKLSPDRCGQLAQLYRNIANYALHMPNNECQELFLNYMVGILYAFAEIPEGISFARMSSTIMANCAPAVYIHSQMVGQIAKTLGEYLIDREPSRFIGICGCTSTSQVKLRRGRIAHMLYECGLYHDLGKIAYLDIFNIISRNLFPEEFEFIRLHARAGFEMLSRHDSTRPYAQVALAHHTWYDGKGGYPEEFDRSTLSCAVLTDLITLADSMDAATDSVLRSYNPEKSLEEFIQEARDQSGTRYAPYAVDLLRGDELLSELKKVLSDGREEAYMCTYRLYRRQIREHGISAEDAEQAAANETSSNPEEDLQYTFGQLFSQFEKSEDVCEKLRLLILRSYGNDYVLTEGTDRFIEIAARKGYVYSQAVGYAMEFWRTYTLDMNKAMEFNSRGLEIVRRVPDYRQTEGYLSLMNNAILGYSILKDYARAYQCAMEILMIIDGKEDKMNFYYAMLNNTSIILSDVGLLNKARLQLEESMANLSHLTAQNVIATQYRYAEILMALGDYGKAQSIFLEMISGKRREGRVEDWQIIPRLVLLSYRKRNGIGIDYWYQELETVLESTESAGLDEHNVIFARAVYHCWHGNYEMADRCFTQLLAQQEESMLDQSTLLRDAAAFYDSWGEIEKSHSLYIQLDEIHRASMKVVDAITAAETEAMQQKASQYAYERLFKQLQQTSGLIQKLVSALDYQSILLILMRELPLILPVDDLLLLIRSAVTGMLSVYPADEGKKAQNLRCASSAVKVPGQQIAADSGLQPDDPQHLQGIP